MYWTGTICSAWIRLHRVELSVAVPPKDTYRGRRREAGATWDAAEKRDGWPYLEGESDRDAHVYRLKDIAQPAGASVMLYLISPFLGSLPVLYSIR